MTMQGMVGVGLPAVVGPGWSGSRGLGPEGGQGREERLREWWGQAAVAWLEVRAARSQHTRRAYEGAVQGFFAGCGVEPWEVGGVQVLRWQQGMREAGLAEATVNLRLAALSSFYAFCCNRFTVVDGVSGREVPLAERNPVMRVERAKISPYERSIYLSVDEVRALLRSIPQDTVEGLRDLALIVTYLYTGRRSSEVRRLRWGDIREEGGRVYYRWWGKGGTSREDELPLPAYNAMVGYLRAAGRLEGMGEGDYVFVALSDVVERLGVTVRGDEPLSASFINRIVKKCARRAGLKWERIHTHTLRHTAAMLRRELTDDLQELQRFLNHSTLATTQIYIQHTEKRKDVLWAQVEALIGIE